MCRPGLDLPRDSRANQKIFLGEIDYRDAWWHSCLPVCVIIRCRSSIPWPVTWLWLLTRKPPCGTIIAEMSAPASAADVELFDIYRSEAIGAGKKSMAFTLHFAPENRALEAADVDRLSRKSSATSSSSWASKIR